jgi:hypothetical protein
MSEGRLSAPDDLYSESNEGPVWGKPCRSPATERTSGFGHKTADNIQLSDLKTSAFPAA